MTGPEGDDGYEAPPLTGEKSDFIMDEVDVGGLSMVANNVKWGRMR